MTLECTVCAMRYDIIHVKRYNKRGQTYYSKRHIIICQSSKILHLGEHIKDAGI